MQYPEDIDTYIGQNRDKFEDRGGWLPPERYCKEDIELNFVIIEDPLERKYLQEYYFSAGNLVHTSSTPTYIRLFNPDTLFLDMGVILKLEKEYHKSYIYLKDGRVIATFLGNEIFRYIRNLNKWKSIVEKTMSYFAQVVLKHSNHTLSELYALRDKLIEEASKKYINSQSVAYVTINGMKIKKQVVELKIVKYVIYLRQIDFDFFNSIKEESARLSKRRRIVDSTLHQKMLASVDEETQKIISEVHRSGYKRKITHTKFTEIVNLEDDNETVKAPIENPLEWLTLAKYDNSWYLSFFQDEIIEINDYVIEVIKENKVDQFKECYTPEIAEGLEYFITWEGTRIDTTVPETEDSSSDYCSSDVSASPSPKGDSNTSPSKSTCSTCSTCSTSCSSN